MDWLSRIRSRFPAPFEPFSDATGQRNSSVLIALGINLQSGQADILLTKRTRWVESHKGEVSFPGGFWEAGDASLMHTALRESQEEIGTDPKHIEVLGTLAPVQTHQGVTIYPWVGKLTLPYLFTPNPTEVEKILYLPLQMLLERGLEPVTVQVGQLGVKSEGIYVGEELVWGATARILGSLRDRLLG
ncbi:CoA pyrophosphatase [bacterium]|nr:CoA pyrophosphatase [bacterium]